MTPLQEVVPKVFAAIDKAVGKIREDFPLTDVDEWNPVRPELVFESEQGRESKSEGEEPLVHVGPRLSAEQKQLTKLDQDARLDQIRKYREQDPEFARLLSTGGRK